MSKLRHRITRILHVTLLLAAPVFSKAQARFDLSGPHIDIHVTRAGVTLPIARVPNLQAGDQIWLHPDLPPTQSVHYLLIASFLRGTTNPPPDDWFTRVETWNKKVRQEGITVTVPEGAQQAILFLAPETGGDYSTLRSAVKGRPGIFVRASQDLAEAGFEQARIETYLASMKRVPPADSAALLDHSNLLARTLNLRPNLDCFKRPLDQQYNCLTQTGSQALLDDGHAQSIVAALSTGPGSDFISAASATSLAGGGTYSAYVGAIIDLVRLTNSLHTAHYQYIPAIAFPDSTASPETLSLRLNAAPSFHNPKSVIVIGLPAVVPAVLPPLRPADPDHISCLLDPRMVLPIEGAPLVFSTFYAHDLVLHLNIPTTTDLPMLADAYQGGLTLAPAIPGRKELPLASAPANLGAAKAPAPPSQPDEPGQPITGTIRGFWGFDAFTGPTLPLQQVPGAGWRIVTSAETPANLIAGQPNHLQLLSSGTACIRTISLEPGDSRIDWKFGASPHPESPRPAAPAPIPPVRPVDLTLNLQHAATPGSIHLAILQFGQKDPDQLGTRTFAEPARIESLRLHAGDTSATLTGASLNQVKSLTLPAVTKDLPYTPERPTIRDSAQDLPAPPTSLTLKLPPEAKVPAVKPGDRVTAQVHLEDGRTLETSTIVMPPRPAVSLLSKRVESTANPAPASPIQISSPDDLPLGARLIFFLKSTASFPRNEQIEIASNDGSLRTVLNVAAGTLILQDSHTILATFDPLKIFGPSTFGPFHLRALTTDGTEGEWLPLATIVRLPTLTELRCPTSVTLPCQLSGSALYLIDSLSPDLAFNTPTQVPEGFVDTSLAIPHPIAGTFFLRLRDDLTTTHAASLPILPEPAAH